MKSKALMERLVLFAEHSTFMWDLVYCEIWLRLKNRKTPHSGGNNPSHLFQIFSKWLSYRLFFLSHRDLNEVNVRGVNYPYFLSTWSLLSFDFRWGFGGMVSQLILRSVGMDSQIWGSVQEIFSTFWNPNKQIRNCQKNPFFQFRPENDPEKKVNSKHPCFFCFLLLVFQLRLSSGIFSHRQDQGAIWINGQNTNDTAKHRICARILPVSRHLHSLKNSGHTFSR